MPRQPSSASPVRGSGPLPVANMHAPGGQALEAGAISLSRQDAPVPGSMPAANLPLSGGQGLRQRRPQGAQAPARQEPAEVVPARQEQVQAPAGGAPAQSERARLTARIAAMEARFEQVMEPHRPAELAANAVLAIGTLTAVSSPIIGMMIAPARDLHDRTPGGRHFGLSDGLGEQIFNRIAVGMTLGLSLMGLAAYSMSPHRPPEAIELTWALRDLYAALRDLPPDA